MRPATGYRFTCTLKIFMKIEILHRAPVHEGRFVDLGDHHHLPSAGEMTSSDLLARPCRSGSRKKYTTQSETSGGGRPATRAAMTAA